VSLAPAVRPLLDVVVPPGSSIPGASTWVLCVLFLLKWLCDVPGFWPSGLRFANKGFSLHGLVRVKAAYPPGPYNCLSKAG
jgi:hypothetical protein